MLLSSYCVVNELLQLDGKDSLKSAVVLKILEGQFAPLVISNLNCSLETAMAPVTTHSYIYTGVILNVNCNWKVNNEGSDRTLN